MGTMPVVSNHRERKPAPTKLPKPNEVEKDRQERFENLGFTSKEAGTLAMARDLSQPGGYAADVHRVKKMLEGGASHKQVVVILT